MHFMSIDAQVQQLAKSKKRSFYYAGDGFVLGSNHAPARNVCYSRCSTIVACSLTKPQAKRRKANTDDELQKNASADKEYVPRFDDEDEDEDSDKVDVNTPTGRKKTRKRKSTRKGAKSSQDSSNTTTVLDASESDTAKRYSVRVFKRKFGKGIKLRDASTELEREENEPERGDWETNAKNGEV